MELMQDLWRRQGRWWLACAALVLLLAAPTGAQEAAPNPSAPTPVASAPAASAEAIADQEALRKLQADLATRQTEYDAAVKELSELRGDVASQRQLHAELQPGGVAATIAASQEELERLEERLELAAERVDLAIADRKAVQALLAQLEKKIDEERADKTPATTPAPATTTASEKPATTVGPTGLPAVTSSTKASPAKAEAEPSARVADADAVASKKEAEVSQARAEAEAIDKRKAALEANLELERKRLATSYQRHDNLSQTMLKLEEEFFRELSAGKAFTDLTELSQRRDQTREQLQTISDEIKAHSERVELLKGQLLGIAQEKLLAAEEVQAKEAEADVARRNQWLVTISDYAIVTLPRVALILIVMCGLYWGMRVLGRRLIAFLSDTQRGTVDERRYRTQTLTSVFENAATTALYVVGGLMILDTLRVPVGTLLGGVAVIGLAVAFGAQNLIRDYFSGFMVLLEDQYKINDLVTINGMTGTVERITLRITVLRDFDGKVYFIPNGQVTSVINQTHEWSRAVLDIPVSYAEKIEKVMGVLLELAQTLASDPAFKDSVLREPELFGVDKLADSAVIVRLCLVTRPSQKDTIRREMLRRIKARFDELGIEIPYPQQTVHLRSPAVQGEIAPPENDGKGASPPTPTAADATGDF